MVKFTLLILFLSLHCYANDYSNDIDLKKITSIQPDNGIVGNQIDILVPRYADWIEPKENQFNYVFSKLGIAGEPRVKKDSNYYQRNIVKTKYSTLNLDIIERKNHSLLLRFTHLNSKKIKDIQIYFNNRHYSEYNLCYTFSSVYDPTSAVEMPKWGNYGCGRFLEVYEVGTVRSLAISETCWDVIDQHLIDSCRPSNSIHLSSPKGNRIYKNVDKCPHKCYEFLPYLNLGSYVTRYHNVKMYKGSSRKSIIIKNLEMNMNVEVILDSKIIEEINEDIAPWVKIRLKDGTEGFIFGADIKKPGEFWN